MDEIDDSDSIDNTDNNDSDAEIMSMLEFDNNNNNSNNYKINNNKYNEQIISLFELKTEHLLCFDQSQMLNIAKDNLNTIVNPQTKVNNIKFTHFFLFFFVLF